MCSVGDDIEENEKLMPEKNIFKLFDNKCMKCRTAIPVIVLQNKYPYCKECFINGTTHKFKALLGKNRVIHVGDQVLIWHRTGHPSTSLLHFLRNGLDLATPKKIKFIPIILFIEDHYNLPSNQRKDILKKIDEEVKTFKFPVYYIALCDYMLDEVPLNSIIHDDYTKINFTENDFTIVKKVFKKNAKKSVEKEVIKIFQHQLLTKVAKYLNCSSVFIPDLAIDIASQLLSSVSLGRGAHTVYDIGTVDSRDEDVKILRPLRNFTIKELAFYNFFHNLEPVTYIIPEENPYSSIQSLMNKFVLDLQVNYPATVSTIVRTGDKLSLDKTVQYNEKCLLCKAPIENKHNYLQSAEATNLSHWISTQSSNYNTPIEVRTEHVIGEFNNTLESKYCFACNRIVNYL